MVLTSVFSKYGVQFAFAADEEILRETRRRFSVAPSDRQTAVRRFNDLADTSAVVIFEPGDADHHSSGTTTEVWDRGWNSEGK